MDRQVRKVLPGMEDMDLVDLDRRKADTAIAYSESFHPAPLLTHRVLSLLAVVTHFQISQYCSHEICQR